jgi:hypothetical protein
MTVSSGADAHQPAPASSDGPTPPPSNDGGPAAPHGPGGRSARIREFVRALRDGDEAMVEDTVLRLAQSRRAFAPLALVVGGFAMLFNGLKLLFLNWRLTLVQVVPAMWIWLALFDLKIHALHGKSFHVLRGPVLIPILLAIAAITAASFFLNAVFGFAIVQPGVPEVRPAFARARARLGIILGSGIVVGLMLGFATMIVTRWGRPWFGIALSIVIGVMMVCYVAVPARLIGVKPASSRRDKLTASAVGGAVGAVVCTPPYVLGRIGVLMLGSHVLFVPGILLIAIGATLQAGATGAVKTVQMSAKLLTPHRFRADPAAPDAAAPQAAAPPAPGAGESEMVAADADAEVGADVDAEVTAHLDAEVGADGSH